MDVLMYATISGSAGIVLIISCSCYFYFKRRRQLSKRTAMIIQHTVEPPIPQPIVFNETIDDDNNSIISFDLDFAVEIEPAKPAADENIVSSNDIIAHSTVSTSVRSMYVDELVNKYLSFSAHTLTREDVFKKYNMLQTPSDIKRLKDASAEINIF